MCRKCQSECFRNISQQIPGNTSVINTMQPSVLSKSLCLVPIALEVSIIGGTIVNTADLHLGGKVHLRIIFHGWITLVAFSQSPLSISWLPLATTVLESSVWRPRRGESTMTTEFTIILMMLAVMEHFLSVRQYCDFHYRQCPLVHSAMLL